MNFKSLLNLYLGALIFKNTELLQLKMNGPRSFALNQLAEQLASKLIVYGYGEECLLNCRVVLERKLQQYLFRRADRLREVCGRQDLYGWNSSRAADKSKSEDQPKQLARSKETSWPYDICEKFGLTYIYQPAGRRPAGNGEKLVNKIRASKQLKSRKEQNKLSCRKKEAQMQNCSRIDQR
ncbi:hypothetical protein F511_23150 [Dorcoceras hygrometricum]|uniref:Uncharacterized protein n=1 Tax=Dorcoceras hygrometricum TaxID=472368 RepID=A0A2Z7C937_9LAMI|nr:hypothetical protein F511_23150 [Dorcoceras hygrometricum]